MDTYDQYKLYRMNRLNQNRNKLFFLNLIIPTYLIGVLAFLSSGIFASMNQDMKPTNMNNPIIFDTWRPGLLHLKNVQW